MTRGVPLACALALFAACKPAASRPEEPHAEPAVAAPAVAAPEEAASTFGAPIDPATPEVTLADLARDPAAHAGRRVRTRGTVHRVCQRAGCWMELAEEGVEPVFVPMAGHAFFLPRSAEGQRAEVEGTIELRTMGAGERAHLESEGATATGARAQLVAAGVRLEGAAGPQDS